ncbi:MAG TPA: acyltransferase family protein [Candidatus Anaerostipes excrementavium]|uniref:Acyltransferase family protein n=1 Tax=Candidatus Anaerostipes excrementavium TaxID=2838463 RepID=A0A9D2B7U3_9FIRM|nr:acyltransferase family protein [uncultured Anaerostipes sp.]HIX66490.1 acyltransferase family protein [Candidatus Anaerostipes excrementavium]
MQKNSRIMYIDLCKGLGILMVTLGHITTLANPVDMWMSSMKLSIFFVAAGYLICLTDYYQKKTFKGYIVKLLKSLIVPYLCFSVLGIGFRFTAMVLQHTVNMAAIKSYIFATITFRGIFALWFLPVLFLAEILFFCLIRYAPKLLRLLILIVFPLLAVWYGEYLAQLKILLTPLWYERISFVLFPIGKAMVALWYLYIGYLGCKLCLKIKQRRILTFIGVIFFISNIFLSQQNMHVDMNHMEFGTNPECFFIGGIIGSFGALLLFQCLEMYWKFPVLNYFGRNSLILMSTQRPLYVLEIASAGWHAFSASETVLSLRYYVDSLGTLAIVLIMEYSIITFINKKLKFMLGKF